MASSSMQGAVGLRVAFDMGGTTAKACLIEDGHAIESADYEVGAGINAGGLTKGAGYALSVSAFDIAEVGAGGGSVAWLDEGGALRVGPHSAGAVPGPAAYGRGGTHPTITDANVVLGYMNATAIAGGSVLLDTGAARRSLEPLAAATGMPLLQVAQGIHDIANATMARAIRAVTSERGRDPRECVMIAFGGAGSMHAANLAASIGIKTVYVPLMPGLFCALGLLLANMRHDLVRSCPGRLAELQSGTVAALFEKLEQELLAEIADKAMKASDWQLQRLVDLRYEGQSSEMAMALPEDVVFTDFSDFGARMTEAFHAEHERSYGYRREHEPVCMANARIRAVAVATDLQLTSLAANFHAARSLDRAGAGGELRRDVNFGASAGLQSAQVLTREGLREPVQGPVVFDEFDTTIVVPPNWQAELDALGNIVLRMQDGAG